MATIGLRPPIKPRERILTFGVGGTGKTAALLEIARQCPTDTFYVADTEFGSYDKLLATDFTDVVNVDVTVCDEWEEFVEFIGQTHKVMGEDDWCAIDFMTQTWPAVQGWFSSKVFGQDIEDYFLEVRMKKKEAGDNKKALGAFDGWMDWPVINKVYFKFYNTLLKTPGHLYLTAEQDNISGDDGKEVKAAFGAYGVKPKGQKKLGHIPSSVLWLTKSRVGKWGITTIKDRGRVELEDEPLENFANDYLKKVAGWRPRPV